MSGEERESSGAALCKQDAGSRAKMCPEGLGIFHCASRHKENHNDQQNKQSQEWDIEQSFESPECKGIPCKHCCSSTAWSILAKFPSWQALPRAEFEPSLLELSGLTRILGSGDKCSMALELQRTKSKQEEEAAIQMELGWFICDAELSHKAKQGNIQ